MSSTELEMPLDEVGFDPNATIEMAGSDDFTDLISAGDGESQEEVAARIQSEMKQTAFGTVSVTDFSDFNSQDITPDTGEYNFSVEQKYLKEACSTTRLTTSSRAAFGAVKVTIFRNKLRLATFNQAAFSEMLIPLSSPSTSIEDGKEVSFIFDHSVLSKISTTFIDAIISGTFVAEKNLLVLRSGETRLELSTFPKTEFIEYHTKIGEPVLKSTINPEVLRKGVRYAAPFVKKDDIQLNLSLIDIRNGQVLGGGYASIGVFSTEALKNIDIKVKYENIKTFEAMLSKFNVENTHLFETDSFYIMRDENLYFGFEKTTFSFPPVDSFFKVQPDDFTLIPRAQFLNSLYKLSVVSIDRDLLVRLQLEGSGADAKITLTTKDSSGKQSRDILSVYRNHAEGQKSTFEAWDVNVNIASLIKIIGHFESANVQLEKLANKALMVVDEGEGYKANTILSLLTEDQVQKVKTAKEQAAA